MFRRACAFLALLAVTGSPAVTSTRLFCRHTGAEIADCGESCMPGHPELRDEGCCVRRTLHALEAARAGGDQVLRLPALAVCGEPFLAPARLQIVPAFRDGAAGAGPPVFLTNRALLI